MQEADTEGIEYSPLGGGGGRKKGKLVSLTETRIFLKPQIQKIYVRDFKDIR